MAIKHKGQYLALRRDNLDVFGVKLQSFHTVVVFIHSPYTIYT
jgi:hypothetical protein